MIIELLPSVGLTSFFRLCEFSSGDLQSPVSISFLILIRYSLTHSLTHSLTLQIQTAKKMISVVALNLAFFDRFSTKLQIHEAKHMHNLNFAAVALNTAFSVVFDKATDTDSKEHAELRSSVREQAS